MSVPSDSLPSVAVLLGLFQRSSPKLPSAAPMSAISSPLGSEARSGGLPPVASAATPSPHPLPGVLVERVPGQFAPLFPSEPAEPFVGVQPAGLQALVWPGRRAIKRATGRQLRMCLGSCSGRGFRRWPGRPRLAPWLVCEGAPDSNRFGSRQAQTPRGSERGSLPGACGLPVGLSLPRFLFSGGVLFQNSGATAARCKGSAASVLGCGVLGDQDRPVARMRTVGDFAAIRRVHRNGLTGVFPLLAFALRGCYVRPHE
jgi:hypothetical protein